MKLFSVSVILFVAVAFSIANTMNDNISVYLHNCLDHRRKDPFQTPPIDAFRNATKFPTGKEQLRLLLQNENTLGWCALAFLPIQDCHACDDRTIAFDFSNDSNVIKEKYMRIMEDFCYKRANFQEYMKENKEMNDGWIRAQWFENDNNLKKKSVRADRLSSIQKSVLYIQLCLLGGDASSSLLLKMWGMSEKTMNSRKTELIKKIKNYGTRKGKHWSSRIESPSQKSPKLKKQKESSAAKIIRRLISPRKNKNDEADVNFNVVGGEDSSNQSPSKFFRRISSVKNGNGNGSNSNSNSNSNGKFCEANVDNDTHINYLDNRVRQKHKTDPKYAGRFGLEEMPNSAMTEEFTNTMNDVCAKLFTGLVVDTSSSPSKKPIPLVTPTEDESTFPSLESPSSTLEDLQGLSKWQHQSHQQPMNQSELPQQPKQQPQHAQPEDRQMQPQHPQQQHQQPRHQQSEKRREQQHRQQHKTQHGMQSQQQPMYRLHARQQSNQKSQRRQFENRREQPQLPHHHQSQYGSQHQQQQRQQERQLEQHLHPQQRQQRRELHRQRHDQHQPQQHQKELEHHRVQQRPFCPTHEGLYIQQEQHHTDHQPQQPPRRLAKVLKEEDINRYPTLINGCNNIDDIPKALEEAMHYCGHGHIWDVIKDRKKAHVIRYERSDGKVDHYVRVPVTSSKKWFLSNHRSTPWIATMLRTAGSGDFSEDDVAACMIEYLIKHHPDVLDKVDRKYLLNARMDPLTSAAMWNEANVPKRGQRVIKQYLYSHFGFWITAAEKRIDALTDHFTRPIHGISKVDEKDISWWYKDIDDVIKNLLDNEWADVDFDEIDVVFGGDHGQGVFGAAVKIILWKDDIAVRKAVEKVGHIDCDKDTYDILNETIASKLNDSLKRLKSKYIRVPKKQVEESTLNDEGNDQDIEVVSYVDAPRHDDTENRYYKIKVVAVGDLAFVSMALGKVNMSGDWCFICDLASRMWKVRGHPKGDDWTLQKMKERIEMLDDGVFRDTPQARKGCVKKALFDSLEPSDWIIPCLHAMMGTMNDAFKGLLKYVEQRHECISDEEQAARVAYWTAIVDLDNAVESLAHLKEVQTNLTTDVTNLKKKKAQRNRSGLGSSRPKFFYSKEDRKRFTEEINSIIKQKKSKQPDVAEKTNGVKMLREHKRVTKSKMAELEKKRGVINSKLRQMIDKCLKDHGIDRGASHGGEFTGVACLVLEDRIEDVISGIEGILLSEGNGEQEEIQEVCESYRLHFLLCSHMFSLSRTSRRDMRDPTTRNVTLDELGKVIPLVDESTERLSLSMLTVKRHLMFHLIDMMTLHDGISEYLEDWVEQIHQRFKKSKSRGKLRDLVKIADYHSRVDKLYHNSLLSKIHEEIFQNRKRPFKGERANSNARAVMMSDARRVRRRQAVVKAKTLFTEKPTLASGFERNLNDIRNGELV